MPDDKETQFAEKKRSDAQANTETTGQDKKDEKPTSSEPQPEKPTKREDAQKYDDAPKPDEAPKTSTKSGTRKDPLARSPPPTTDDEDIALVEETLAAAAAMERRPLPKIDIDNVIDRLKGMVDSDKLLSEVLRQDEIESVAVCARELFAAESTLLELSHLPLRIAGDTHGQYSDLLHIFERMGFPSKDNPWLFLGDYVDRGRQSLETVTLLFAYKVKLPQRIWLLRGNHECASVNRYYGGIIQATTVVTYTSHNPAGFYDECARRYSARLWATFCDTFAVMPLAARVAERILCMHGGLSPRLRAWDDLRNVPRPMPVVPDDSLACDLLWSDPELTKSGWWPSQRGISVQFGSDVVLHYRRLLKIDLVCRAHQVVEDGYEFFADRSLVTVFSAPQYCGEFDNAAAVMTVNPDMLCQFEVIRAPGQVVRVESSSEETIDYMSGEPSTSADSAHKEHKDGRPARKVQKLSPLAALGALGAMGVKLKAPEDHTNDSVALSPTSIAASEAGTLKASNEKLTSDIAKEIPPSTKASQL